MLIRMLRRGLRPYRRAVLWSIVLQLVEVMALLLLPTLNAALINHVVVAGNPSLAWWLGAAMVIVAVVAVATGIGTAFFAARASQSFGRDLRSAVFHHVLDLSVRQVGRFGSSSLATRSINDVQQVERFLYSGLLTLALAPLICFSSLVLAVPQDMQLGGVLLVLTLLIGIVTSVALMRVRSIYSRVQSSVERLNRMLGEQIAGVRVVRAFVRDAYERSRFGQINTALFQDSLAAGRLMAGLFPAVTLISNVATVTIIWLGAFRADSGAVGIGTVNVFVEYLGYIVGSIALMAFVLTTVPRAIVSARRIQEVLDTEPELAKRDRVDNGVAAATGTVELRSVGFRYPGAERPALHEVDLSIAAGETIALIGSTGAGKTTLLNLLVRLADVTTGSVRVNGTDLRELDPEVLTSSVGLVPQHAFLFTGTIAENLRFGRPDATDAELWHALEIAQARDFVERLPGGLDAEISQDAKNISGGQRQRLTIARTVLRKPQICLFDDCFSALDAVTEAALWRGLDAEISSATVVVVCQRLRTTRYADRIVVLEEGGVAGIGTHDELMANNEIYREIAASQMPSLVAR
jgi:ATP-binding cassette, subfamily B, multidrug efflux pump